MQNKELLTDGQNIALNHFLTAWPLDKEFFDILNMIESNSDDITLWHEVDSWDKDTLRALIEDIALDIDNVVYMTRKENK